MHLNKTLGIVVFVHGGIVIAHFVAHVGAGVWLSLFATVYISLVIIIGPFVGLWEIRFGRPVVGTALVTACMAGAFIFGYLNHFVWVGIDHVDVITSVAWHAPFRSTAWLLAVAELVGVVVGSLGLWSLVRGK